MHFPCGAFDVCITRVAGWRIHVRVLRGSVPFVLTWVCARCRGQAVRLLLRCVRTGVRGMEPGSIYAVRYAVVFVQLEYLGSYVGFFL